MRFLIPLILFIVMVAFLAVGLKLDPREVPSPFIGKPTPAFNLPQLADPGKSFSNARSCCVLTTKRYKLA